MENYFNKREADIAHRYEFEEETKQRIEGQNREVSLKLLSSTGLDRESKKRIFSEFETHVSMLQSRLQDEKVHLKWLGTILDPRTHISTKLTEHGPVKGILPAAFYAIATPLLVGVPYSLLTGPKSLYTVVKKTEELENTIAEEFQNEESIEDAVAVLTAVGVQSRELEKLLRKRELDTQFEGEK